MQPAEDSKAETPDAASSEAEAPKVEPPKAEAPKIDAEKATSGAASVALRQVRPHAHYPPAEHDDSGVEPSDRPHRRCQRCRAMQAHRHLRCGWHGQPLNVFALTTVPVLHVHAAQPPPPCRPP